jgi:hypothetical protein
VTIIRVGATKKYSTGWEAAFGKGKRTTEPAAKQTTKKSAAKTSTKKKAAKKAKK